MVLDKEDAQKIARDCLPDQESPCFLIEHIVLTGELSEKFQFVLSLADDGLDRVS